jgi:hypothetical protein
MLPMASHVVTEGKTETSTDSQSRKMVNFHVSNNENTQLLKLDHVTKLKLQDLGAPKFLASTNKEKNKFNLLVLQPDTTNV